MIEADDTWFDLAYVAHPASHMTREVLKHNPDEMSGAHYSSCARKVHIDPLNHVRDSALLRCGLAAIPKRKALVMITVLLALMIRRCNFTAASLWAMAL